METTKPQEILRKLFIGLVNIQNTNTHREGTGK